MRERERRGEKRKERREGSKRQNERRERERRIEGSNRQKRERERGETRREGKRDKSIRLREMNLWRECVSKRDRTINIRNKPTKKKKKNKLYRLKRLVKGEKIGYQFDSEKKYRWRRGEAINIVLLAAISVLERLVNKVLK